MNAVLFIDPITNKPAAMPIEMIGAYLPNATHLHLEEAARVAAIRDEEAATNLLLSMDTEYQTEEGTGFDRLAVPIA